MKRFATPKFFLMLLAVCILIGSVWFYLDSTAAITPSSVLKKCKDYCDKYDDQFYKSICMDGCLNGLVVE